MFFLDKINTKSEINRIWERFYFIYSRYDKYNKNDNSKFQFFFNRSFFLFSSNLFVNQFIEIQILLFIKKFQILKINSLFYLKVLILFYSNFFLKIKNKLHQLSFMDRNTKHPSNKNLNGYFESNVTFTLLTF